MILCFEGKGNCDIMLILHHIAAKIMLRAWIYLAASQREKERKIRSQIESQVLCSPVNLIIVRGGTAVQIDNGQGKIKRSKNKGREK